MTSTFYIIDTSSLIKLNREHPLDVFPSIWDKIEHLVDADRLIAPKEVFHEISQKDDKLTQWAKRQRKLFKDPNSRQVGFAKEILTNDSALLNTERIFDADVWVIALARDLINNPQTTLAPIKRIIVTEEKLRGNKIKIPFVCNKYNIETIDLITLFRTEGWTF